MAKAKESELITLNASDIKMCISVGNKKIGRVMNVSTMPILCCGNCKECSKLCYDIKACLQYPNTVIDARMRNTVLLRKDRDEYFRRIDAAISRRRKNKFFRYTLWDYQIFRKVFPQFPEFSGYCCLQKL